MLRVNGNFLLRKRQRYNLLALFCVLGKLGIIFATSNTMNHKTAKFFLFIFPAMISLLAMGQENIPVHLIDFQKKEISIGEVLESDPPQNIKFTFVNRSDKDFVIENIISSCGCTVAEWQKTPIKPGASSNIDVLFNPSGMFGELEKYIKIKANLSDAPFIELKITGMINSTYFDKPQYYPGQYGYLIVFDYRFNFGEIPRLTAREIKTMVYNDGSEAIKILAFENLPGFLKARSTPEVVAPKDSAHIVFTFSGNDSLAPGLYKGSVKLITTDRFHPRKELTYFIEVLPDFSSMKRSQLKRAPKMTLKQNTVDFGQIKAGGVFTSSIEVLNAGKSPLIIYGHHSDCSCAIPSYPEAIQPGQKVLLPVTFDALFKEGNQSKVITLYTNDPTQPKIQLLVKALVE